MKCNYCGQAQQNKLSLKQIFSFTALVTEGMCQKCQAQFHLLCPEKSCQGCHRPSETQYCLDCQKWQQLYPDYDFHHDALYQYDQAMQEWMKAYKFQGAYHLKSSFALPLKKYFATKRSWFVVPIPVSQQRRIQRGFNQVEGLLDGAGIAYHLFLERIVDDLPQAQRTRQQRLTLKQPFQVSPKFKEKIKNCSILLVDDVYTTGRTLFHAADSIRKYQPKQVQSFSLAR